MSDIPDIEYNLNLEADGVEAALKEYARVVWETRQIVRPVKRKEGKVESQSDIAKLGMKYNDKYIIFTIRKQDIYIIGYRRIKIDDKDWELQSDIKILHDAKNSGIPVDYSGLTNCFFGWGALKNAFEVVWKYDPLVDCKYRNKLHRALQEIIVMICESTRFSPIFIEAYDQIASQEDFVRVPCWVDDMAHKWKKISKAATKSLPMTGIKIPDDFEDALWDLFYDDHDMSIFESRPEGPFFARLAICFPHIGGIIEEEEEEDEKKKKKTSTLVLGV